MMEEKGVRKYEVESTRGLIPRWYSKKSGWGRTGGEKKRERVDSAETRTRERNRHHVTNDGTYKRTATTLLRKWFVYYVVTLRSQANRR